MSLFDFFVSDAFADTAAAVPGAGQDVNGMGNILMLVAMGAIFYFLLIRPQSKRAKAHKQLVESLSIGDQVVTAGGIHGKIVALQDSAVTLEISTGVKVKFNRSSIVGGQKAGGEQGE